MMRRTNIILFILLLISVNKATWAKTDPECLKHLGGTSYDVNCYGGLTKDIQNDSHNVYKKLISSMPENNRFRNILNEYMKAQDSAEKFCILDKEAGTNWEPSPTPNSYNMWDAIEAGCVYNTRKLQNKRLHDLLKLHSEQ